jgi:putative tryptophan/tyrosine transport system substrate-binding protein
MAWYRSFQLGKQPSLRVGYMPVTIGRRELIAMLGGAAAWPLTARAQQSALPVIGWLAGGTSEGYAPFAAEFRQGLKETGYVEGQNVAIEYRWAEGQNEKLPSLAADLVRLRVTVIAAAGTPSAFAAKTATATIPVVFSTAVDPLEAGLVASLNHPGGNVTGATNFVAALAAKQFELLREVVPTASVFGLLVNPTDQLTEYITRDVEAAAAAHGKRIHILNASTEGEIDRAFFTLAELRAGAVIIGVSALFVGQRNQIVALAARYTIPAMYPLREFTAAGGLISYGTSLSASYRQVGIYTGRILKGERPADLPVVQPTKFEFVINLKTAKALGLTVPLVVQMTADEVIE